MACFNSPCSVASINNRWYMGKSAHTTGASKTVGVWLRVSTEIQAEGDSPEHHKARALSYAAAKGWTVAEVYDLSGVSGKSVMEHSETRRMMADVKRGHITGLIFSKLARLARNTRTLLDFAEFFQEHGADLISIEEAIDTGSPAGRLFYTVIAAMAEWERSEIAGRVQASVVVRAKMGKPLGQLPYGYRYKDGKVEPDEKEAPVRRLVYELFAEHKRKRTVARLLNEKGLRTRGGKHFSATTVARLITDPTAKGEYRTNYTKNIGAGKSWALKPEHEWVITKVDPIVSEELWTRCNGFIEARRTTGVAPTKKAVHAFTGIAVCFCGGKMYVPSNSPKYICLKCRNKIPVVDLDGLFRDELKAYLTASDRIQSFVTQAESGIEEKRQAIKNLKDELAAQKRDFDRNVRLYGEGAMSGAQFKEWFQPIDQRKKQIEKDIPRLEGEIAMLSVDSVSAEDVLTEATTFYERWPSFSPPEKRHLVETLVKRIAIGKDEVEIELCYLPSLETMAEGITKGMDSWRPPA